MSFWKKYNSYSGRQKWFIVNRIAVIIVENFEQDLLRNFVITLDKTVTNRFGIKVPLLEYIKTHFSINYKLILSNDQIKDLYLISFQVLTCLYYKTQQLKCEEFIENNCKNQQYWKKKQVEYEQQYNNLKDHLISIGYNFEYIPKPIVSSQLFVLEK